ncbi:dicarboxylate/amino acid:cation symporter [Allofrancisella guangzhouensis]|uniref:Sodium:dicarboxylate symporter n=1 Tax=Allofrancisella guangzhouensis TaxID=594679 RepID=A0A0A8E6L5_9GAMM|nr:dicarboxylate/amino acid:cation symporter [Allofrancisella guangzhouensis]AJC49564.1 sodium:dicarboxylate symporter [Allofrancisella guangzhouensis]MBK2026778.1 dicarboxylate/amino acid:cation symporter [Allofrancisella guangzhouensis]MBK2044450.1 dicarboxylate/amino acid:cation symporter [Allofrancisella guangzhouensis]MBK2045342.1 dicarboxylate/amino acid:cation symporter [Allofrancisella guangzhouensis]
MLFILIVVFLLLVFLQLKDYSFNFRTILALIAGIVIGILYTTTNYNSEVFIQATDILGDGYISLLKMLIIPIVLTSIVHSIVNLKNYNSSSIIKFAYKTIATLLILTGVSAAIGATVAIIMNIGHGLDIASITGEVAKEMKTSSFSETILSFLPDNLFHQMDNNNVMAVVIFAILLGFSMLIAHREDSKLAKPFIDFIDSAFFVIKKLARMVISVTPYGVLGLMIQMSIELDKNSISTVLYFILTCYIAMLIVLTMHIGLLIVFKTNLIRFYKSIWKAMLVAATSRSSMGTLPLSIEGLNKYGISSTIATFAPTMGTTLGMNACAGVFPAVLAIMAMNATGVDITFSSIVLISFICMLASLGVSGIPGTAFVAAGIVFSYFGLPWQLIALIIGVDAIIDSFRTPLNIHGSMTTAIIVDKSTKIN